MQKKIKVLITASELTPIAKVGGLGDVIGALPHALRQTGVDARVIIARYEQISKKGLKVKLKNVPIKFGRVAEKVTLYQTTIKGLPVYLIDNAKYLSRGPIYGSPAAFAGAPKELDRFFFLSQAVVALLPQMKWQPGIVHCHDWHTALIPQLLKAARLPQKTLLTIHNLGYGHQGAFPSEHALTFLGATKKLQQSESFKNLSARDQHGNLNLLQQGLLTADLLNTVSPNYAKEILTKEFGAGLEKITRAKKYKLHGIVNGIDVERFNPTKDPHIFKKYDTKSFNNGKNFNKEKLLKKFKLKNNSAGPLFGLVTRLTYQKGIDLIVKSVPTLVKLNARFVFLGQGQKELEEGLVAAQKKYPDKVAGMIGFDAELAQQIYAASDIFLMPSLFEPCGLGQMISMRYGTIPIVRDTGGLHDTVKNYNVKCQMSNVKCSCTGFVFKEYSAKALQREIKRAVKVYLNSPKTFQQMQKNSLTKDFSWNKSAKKYIGLYKTLLK